MQDEPLDLVGHFWRHEEEQPLVEATERDERTLRERWAGRLVEDPVRGVLVTASAPDRVDLFMETFAPLMWGRSVDQLVTMTDVTMNVAGKLPGGTELTLRPWLTFVGRRGFESEDEIAFKRLVLRVEGLDVWAARSGFGRLWIPSLEDATVRYQQPASLHLGTVDGVKIELGFWASASTQGDPTVRLELQQTAVLQFEADEPILYSVLEPLAQHTRNYLIFAARQALDVLFVRGYVNPPDEELTRYPNGYLEPITIVSRYFPRRDPAEAPPTRRDEFLFSAPRAGHASKLERWIGLTHEDSLGPVLDLYLSTMYQPRAFVEYQFIALAQAAEILHTRRVRQQAYNISIRALLLRLPSSVRALFPPPHLFARKCEASRILHVHGNPKKRADAATTFDELAGLTQALRCLLEAVLLLEIGFTDTDVDILLEKNLNYRRQLVRGLSRAGF